MEAIHAHKRALELDPAFREALANIGQAYKDYGNSRTHLPGLLLRAFLCRVWDAGVDPLLPSSVKAEKYFAKGLKVDPNYMHAFHLRGLARFGAGDHRYSPPPSTWQAKLVALFASNESHVPLTHRGALSDFTAALRVDDKHKDSRLMRGIVLHGLVRAIRQSHSTRSGCR
jgi:tetratricopeptide (TPR) repeat protein